MENMEPIQINNNILKPGGAIGRLTYFWQGLVLGLISGIFAGVAENLLSAGKASTILLLPVVLVGFVVILVSVYACLLLVHKRCVDILGKRENSVVMAAGIILANLIPYVGIIAGLYLLFAKGKISSNVNAQQNPQDIVE